MVQALTSEKVRDGFWDTKVRVVEITSMVLKAVGYGSVILTATERTQLVKVWLPFIRETKPVLDSLFAVEKMSLEMDVDLCQSIENALVSLVLSLPSGDQAEILADWLRWDHARFSPLPCPHVLPNPKSLIPTYQTYQNKHLKIKQSPWWALLKPFM